MNERRLSENIQIDDESDTLTAFGTRISGELMRTLGEPSPPGRWFRIVRRDDGVATIQTKVEDVNVRAVVTELEQAPLP